jgi:DNA repair exonuclease SbcCD ATPase subunit
MKIVDEPAEEVEAQLRERGIEVRREPYDPKSRSLFSDFLRFLREPESGDTVTLWEDERKRVRYYTAERVDPQIAALQERVSELSTSDATVLEPRFTEIDAKLARLDELERKVVAVDELHAKVQKVDELATQVEQLRGLEAKVAQVDRLAAEVEKLPTLETKVTELENLSTRVRRLERPG